MFRLIISLMLPLYVAGPCMLIAGPTVSSGLSVALPVCKTSAPLHPSQAGAWAPPSDVAEGGTAFQTGSCNGLESPYPCSRGDSLPEISVGQVDTTALRAKLSEYLKTMAAIPVKEKVSEVDFLLETCRDDGTRSLVASQVYSHFRHSPLMGDEAVAVHIADKWISAGKASLGSVVADMDAKIFADFNRNSLIGCRAPGLVLEAPDGRRVAVIPGSEMADQVGHDVGGDGRLKILFFYDTGCSVCKREMAALRQSLAGKNYPADFVAVYTGADRDAWDKNIAENQSFTDSNIPIFHYWDPSLDSDFRKNYGILGTPKLFLINGDGIVIGRGLDAAALAELLKSECREPDYNSEVYGKILPQVLSDGSCLSPDEALELVRYLHDGVVSTGPKSDRKQLISEMLYYLWGRKEPGLKAAAVYVADSLVLSNPKLWDTASDSLVVWNFAEMVHDLSSKAPIGRKLPPSGLKGRMKGPVYVIFYSVSCPACKEELRMAEGCKEKVLKVEVGSLSGRKARRLADKFDLSSLPLILHIDAEGKVDGKYLTFKCL